MYLNIYLMEFIQGSYASADFTDSDAGAGGLAMADLDGFVNIKTAIQNLVDSTTNIIEATTGDYRKLLDSQRRNLQLLCCVENLAVFEKFLKPQDEQENVKTLVNLTNKLNSNSFNPSSRDFFKELTIDLSGNTDSLKEELGFDYVELHSAIAKINDLYHTSVTCLFLSDETLQANIKAVERLLKQVDTILVLDENPTSSELYASLSKYIHATFEKINLAESFTSFIEARRKFVYYRNLLGIKDAASIEGEPPICNICMEQPVSTAFVSCGHTFCSNCAMKQAVTCYICRCRINQKLRLYFN